MDGHNNEVGVEVDREVEEQGDEAKESADEVKREEERVGERREWDDEGDTTDHRRLLLQRRQARGEQHNHKASRYTRWRGWWTTTQNTRTHYWDTHSHTQGNTWSERREGRALVSTQGEGRARSPGAGRR